jgi:hypothetical protein
MRAKGNRESLYTRPASRQAEVFKGACPSSKIAAAGEQQETRVLKQVIVLRLTSRIMKEVEEVKSSRRQMNEGLQ